MQTKRMLVTTLKPDSEAGHPRYVEKSVLAQIWERIKPILIFILGLVIGWVVG